MEIKATLWREHDNWLLQLSGPRWALEDFSKHIQDEGIRISCDVTITMRGNSSPHLQSEKLLLEAGPSPSQLKMSVGDQSEKFVGEES